MIINNGKLATDSTPSELRLESKYNGAVVARFKNPDDIPDIEGVTATELRDNGDTILFSENAVETMEKVRSSCDVLSLSINGGELEDVFYKYSSQ